MNYWENAALIREAENYKEAGAAIREMLELYDAALKDIQGEIDKIVYNYGKRFGIDEETAKLYLSRAMQEGGNDELIGELLNGASDEERKALLDFIHLDGLSTRAYGARAQTYKALSDNIALRMISLERSLRTVGEAARRDAYRSNYYRAIDDTAKGLNVGVGFGIIDDAALENVMEKPWHGKRFSARIWDNTDRLADEAQEIVGKYIISGRDPKKAAQELAEAFEVEKFHAETLIRTEIAHARSMSDMKAYEDIGTKRYRYLATLDERTCPVCGGLDGKIFELSEAAEGVNYPVMHPRCRCTTTMDIRYFRRRARNPITGRNDVTDGSLTYDTWRQNMSDEEKAAFEKAGRKYRNKAADKRQYEEYKEILGSKNMPKSFDKFQEMKYNEDEKKTWELLKDYKNSRSSNMISAFTSFEDYKEYKKKINDELVGLVTIDGVEIKSQSKHFIERVFGTSEDPHTKRPRDGVDIEDIKEALINGTTKHRRDSLRYFGNRCVVSVNKDSGILIQTNPK